LSFWRINPFCFENGGTFAVKTQAKKFVATEKRILTPSGRLQQVAALVYRYEAEERQVLVITSRGTGRWVIPKGWPQVGRTLAETAAREAYEEAGVRGERILLGFDGSLTAIAAE